jgi:general secretion pathway protein M
MEASVAGKPGLAPGALGQRLAPVRTWWATLPARERGLVLLAGAVLGLFVIWVTAVQPAWRALSSAPAQLATLDAQLQNMQRLAGEAGELRATPPLGAAQSSLALKAASDRLGDKAKLVVQGDRAVLTLNGASSEALRNWLAEARSGARVRPVEAQLARGPQGFTGTLTVTMGGAP